MFCQRWNSSQITSTSAAETIFLPARRGRALVCACMRDGPQCARGTRAWPRSCVRACLCVFFGDASLSCVFDGQSPVASLKLAAVLCFGFASHLSLLSRRRSCNSDFKLTRLLLTRINNAISPVSRFCIGSDLLCTVAACLSFAALALQVLADSISTLCFFPHVGMWL